MDHRFYIMNNEVEPQNPILSILLLQSQEEIRYIWRYCADSEYNIQ